jgi:septal ring factor EnvC (AmiA/AmiB activator)
MLKFVVPIIAAASALAVASPAAAQWRPPVYNYQPYNFDRGFEGHAFARAMNDRVQRIRGDIRDLQQRRVLSWREARSLENQAANIQQRIFWASRNGIQPGEARGLERQIRGLEFRISREANDWNNRPGGFRRY